MLQTDSEFTKTRWICTVIGLGFYLADIVTDVGLAVKYFLVGNLVWAGLTLLFVVVGSATTQVFSYTWYRDDMRNPLVNPDGDRLISGMNRGGLIGLHVMQMGVFTRYYHLLKAGHKAVWSKSPETVEFHREVHLDLFGQATDLSMLKLFETFLESVPQLLFQLYILLGCGHKSILQCICMVGSFINIAWAIVDYRRCLRRSLPQVQEMPSGLPTFVYLLYKLLTITTHILSLSLFLILSPYSTLGMAVVWLAGTVWAHWVRTDFCTSRGLERLYRIIVGVVLMFTFFNVKGQDTSWQMAVYYILFALVNFSGPLLLVLVRPEVNDAEYFWPVTLLIFGGTVLGLAFLLLYYTVYHPRGRSLQADEVDGQMGQEREPDTMLRMRNFLQL
ncbi:XK-related protein 9 [Salmo salar]|uniref:XK-related protein n=1 Tax=Salmo salar TaxID=8030 RepID=A0A1S3QBG3_SALSA|nr:XK-related protein 9-like [Salmo salar]|eukprot:XP_014037281.1 PREDICTED: XK-related protein 9-like isoform X2 [Salmo salar]